MTKEIVFVLCIFMFSNGFAAWREANKEEPAVQKPATKTDTIIVEKDTTDTAGDYEVFDYSSDNDNYKLITKPKPPQKLLEPHPARQDEGSSTRDQKEDLYIPPAPTRPIGKTIAGIILTINGGISTILGIIALTNRSSYDYGGYDNRPPGIIYILPGLGMFIPGIAFLAASSSDWSKYNEWEKKYDDRQSAGPRFGVRYTFTF